MLARLIALVLLLAVATVGAPGCGGSTSYAPTPSITAATAPSGDPLPSWNDGLAKRGVIDFVTRVTNAGPEFVPVEDRNATFDNDGTLWQEKPLAEGAFALAMLTKMAEANPSLRVKQPYKAALERDVDTLRTKGREASLELMTITHTGMTDDVYVAEVRQFLATSHHPRWRVPYTSLVYAPMVELLGYLRANGFTTYIASGGDVDFMRAFARTTYGIAPEHVIGSRFEKELVTKGGRTGLMRKPKLETVNDKEQKPVSIDRQLGKRPIFAAGNVGTGGDIAMLSYTRDRPGPSFALVINHDDAARESSYAEPDDATLSAAHDHGFMVVSMQRDWKVVFGRR